MEKDINDDGLLPEKPVQKGQLIKEDLESKKKDFRDRYERMSGSDQFKRDYDNKSVTEPNTDYYDHYEGYVGPTLTERVKIMEEVIKIKDDIADAYLKRYLNLCEIELLNPKENDGWSFSSDLCEEISNQMSEHWAIGPEEVHEVLLVLHKLKIINVKHGK